MVALESGVAHRTEAVRPLLLALAEEFAAGTRQVSVTCDPDLQLRPAQLRAVEAVVREALANAVTHAFADGRPGRIWLTLTEERGRCQLKIADNGPGFPELGGRMCRGRDHIAALARELDGYSRFDNRNYGGAEVSVAFRAAVGV